MRMTHSVVPGPPVTDAAELLERCDRCGAAGKIRVFLPSGGDLAFCGHHAHLYATTIRTSSKRIVIETGFGWQAT
jgi:hypothetical protein